MLNNASTGACYFTSLFTCSHFGQNLTFLCSGQVLDCGYEHKMGLLPLSAHTHNPLSHKAEGFTCCAVGVCKFCKAGLISCQTSSALPEYHHMGLIIQPVSVSCQVNTTPVSCHERAICSQVCKAQELHTRSVASTE